MILIKTIEKPVILTLNPYAKYDGDDRWLKRVRIARDLRKSRSQRNSGNDRIIK